MKLAPVVVLSLQGVALAAPATPTVQQADDVDLIWHVRAFPGGPLLQLNGTIQQVHGQLLKINPEFDHVFGISDHLTHASPQPSPAVPYPPPPVWNATIPKIKPAPPSLPGWEEINFEGKRRKCGGPLEYIEKSYIQEGIRYLRDLPFEVPRLPPGSCGRVSCSWDAAIKWCNQNQNLQSLKSMKTIADGAQYLVKNCNKYPLVSPRLDTASEQPARDRVSGEVWHERGWSVIVGKEEC
ncbi:hypothetical protein QBC40DRAFT_256168 [Triangularia verruculosa]|uniref:Uncharacterized protein n=1 Tax=Triangularia verruculosa TaxID=2587418 RepID=A0AAN7AT97_9PEZI|nr:hypothetical protein QBC40DRAFT_256168 [Triangularia verruculosa]